MCHLRAKLGLSADSPLEEGGFEPSVPLHEVAVPELPEWSNKLFLKAFFRTADRGFGSRSLQQDRHVANVSNNAFRSWSSILHSRILKQAPALAGEGCVSPPIRPCAVPRPSGRGLLAETTAPASGHTCRMRPARERRPYPALPSLPQCDRADRARPRASDRSSENRGTTGSAVLPPRSPPRILGRNKDRTQCATNVLPKTDRADRA